MLDRMWKTRQDSLEALIADARRWDYGAQCARELTTRKRSAQGDQVPPQTRPAAR